MTGIKTNSAAVKAVIHERGLTQNKAAPDIRLSPSTLSKILNGRSCSIEQALRLARWVGRPVEAIFQLREPTDVQRGIAPQNN